ncbi:MAG: hypothetical protein HOE90_14095 [Bacteriovoracaceae bacterium]|jgi:hypothetical protein|nr:hypothetical protein [Bacteriovoracaceae bacterium]
MDFIRKIFPIIILIELAAVLILQHLLADNYNALGVAKYMVNTSIFAVSLLIPKLSKDHKLLGRIFLFIWLADFFFVLLGTFPGFSPEHPISRFGGMLFFGLAYIGLMVFCAKGFKFDKKQLLVSSFVLVTILISGAICYENILPQKKPMFWIFFSFMFFMGSSSIGTAFRDYYIKEVRVLLSLAGLLFLLSEMGFGAGMFYPGLSRNDPWLGNEIWITYIPGWTLCLLALSREEMTIGRSIR